MEDTLEPPAVSQMEIEVGIVTDDVDLISTFYEKAFGFEVITTLNFPQGVVRRLARGRARMKIHVPVESPAVEPEGPLGAKVGIRYFALHVDDAEKYFRRAVAAGAKVVSEPYTHRPGAVVALVRDPGGTVIEILQEAT